MLSQSPVRPNISPLDPRHFRAVLSHFCSGITVLTAYVAGCPVGMTCQSFISVSISPPLVAFCVGRASTTFPLLKAADGLVVNVLESMQHAVSAAFARSGTDKFADIEWTPSEIGGHPVLDGALAVLECVIEREIDAGDHILVIAHVHRLWSRPDGEPLLYFRSAYHGAHPLK